MTDIETIANRVPLVLKHAKACELPAPRSVRVTGDHEHIVLFVRSISDLTEWSHWIGQPIEHLYADTYTIRGEVLDAPVHVHYDAEPLELIDGQVLFDSEAHVA